MTDISKWLARFIPPTGIALVKTFQVKSPTGKEARTIIPMVFRLLTSRLLLVIRAKAAQRVATTNRARGTTQKSRSEVCTFTTEALVPFATKGKNNAAVAVSASPQAKSAVIAAKEESLQTSLPLLSRSAFSQARSSPSVRPGDSNNATASKKAQQQLARQTRGFSHCISKRS